MERDLHIKRDLQRKRPKQWRWTVVQAHVHDVKRDLLTWKNAEKRPVKRDL